MVPTLADAGLVQGRVEAGHPGVAHQVPDDAEDDAGHEDDESQPLDDGLPGADPPVVQEEEAHSQPGQGSTEMTHEAGPVVRVVQADVDSEAHVVDRQQEDEGGPDDHRHRLLHNLKISQVLPTNTKYNFSNESTNYSWQSEYHSY